MGSNAAGLVLRPALKTGFSEMGWGSTPLLPATYKYIMESLIYRLRKRAEIRRQIATRKSVQEGKPDRIAELLEEAAARLEQLEAQQPA